MIIIIISGRLLLHRVTLSNAYLGLQLRNVGSRISLAQHTLIAADRLNSWAGWMEDTRGGMVSNDNIFAYRERSYYNLIFLSLQFNICVGWVSIIASYLLLQNIG